MSLIYQSTRTNDSDTCSKRSRGCARLVPPSPLPMSNPEEDARALGARIMRPTRRVSAHMPLKRWCVKRSRPADEAVLCNLLCKFCTRIFVDRGFRGIGDLESKFVQ